MQQIRGYFVYTFSEDNDGMIIQSDIEPYPLLGWIKDSNWFDIWRRVITDTPFMPDIEWQSKDNI